MRTLRYLGTILFASLLLSSAVAAGCSSSSSPTPAGTPGGNDAGASTSADAGGDAGHAPTATTGTVARGQYLVDHVLACGVCHTPTSADGKPDMSKYLAGSRNYDFTDKDGTVVSVYAENLTTHNPEGLATWSDEQIRTAITGGIDDEHVALYPIMPYPEYSTLTRADQDSIIQYLRTVPANENVVPTDYPYSDQNPPVPAVDAAKVPHTTLPSTDPSFASAERGRYLATLACLNCHTPQLSEDVPDLSKAFAGGKKYTLIKGAPLHTSTNITPDPTGLATWTVDDIVAAIQADKEKGTGRVLCSSHPGGGDYLGKMADGDARDVATYIHTLPAVKNGPFKCTP
jgi:mono/diheme cytochrome c family protein